MGGKNKKKGRKELWIVSKPHKTTNIIDAINLSVCLPPRWVTEKLTDLTYADCIETPTFMSPTAALPRSTSYECRQEFNCINDLEADIYIKYVESRRKFNDTTTTTAT